MKVSIYVDEMYPFFGVDYHPDRFENPFELDGRTDRRFRRIMREFRAMQDELRDLSEYHRQRG